MTPKFIKTSVRKSEHLGEKLSKKRVSLGFEIKDVERATRIRAKHIEYIEASQWDKLPPDVYVRGFLANYAKLLRLNPKKVTHLYLKERGLSENIKKVTRTPVETTKPKVRSLPKVILTPKKMAIGGAVLAGLIVVFYIIFQINILAAPPKLALKTPNDNTKTSEDSILVEGQTDAGAKVSVNNIPIGVDPEGAFKEKVSLQDGVNLITITAINQLDKKTEQTLTVVANLKPIVETRTETDLSMKIIIGPEAASVKIVVDGKALSSKEELMLAGSSQSIRATKNISISASDGGDVRIYLNNADLGKLGAEGKKVENKVFDLSSLE